jgi:hypothetical protein
MIDAPFTLVSSESAADDPVTAAAELVGQLGPDCALYLLFVTVDYPRDELAAELSRHWGDRLIGCTSSGNIGARGFDAAPVLAIGLSGGDLRATTIVIEPLTELSGALSRAHTDLTTLLRAEAGRSSFGLLLVDGLSMAEEYLTAALKSLLGETPLIGGSAADDLTFAQTAVLADGRFASDRATLTVVSTSSPFTVFRMHHYEPQGTIMVITKASPDQRLVHEINGRPAADAFADAIGASRAELGAEIFSANPILLRAADEYWVRSISAPLPDGSLQFFSAIDSGAVLRLGRASDPVRLLRERLESIRLELGGSISGILAFDCVLRRIELGRAGLHAPVSEVLSEYRAAGFSTYGEQFEDFHMNQTIVGVAFGGPAQRAVHVPG